MSSQLYYNGTIITVDSSRRIILDGAILVVDGRIAAIGKADALSGSASLPSDVQRVDLKQRIVIPGLINGHVHLIQSIMRGLAEDLGLHDWASCAIWPLEVSFREDDAAIAASLAVTEMIKSGTTCFLEPMLPSSKDNQFSKIVQAVGSSGMRACLGKLVKVSRSDPSKGIVDDRDKQAAEMSVQKALDAYKEYHGAFNGRVHVWMAAETPRGQDADSFKAVGTACKEHNIRLTVHVAEARKDKEMIETNYGASPLEFCESMGFVGEHVVLGHAIHLAEQDFAILKRTGTSIAHNPTSNTKLADGIAPVPRLLSQDTNVCIGSDGAPCNNCHDLFRDMHLAGILHKGVHEDPSLLPSEQVLEMVTINAAKALGVDKEVGSLETGKKADFVVLDHTGIHTAPYDPAQIQAGGLLPPVLVVHSLSAADVRMVVVDGEVLVEDGKLTKIDEEKVKKDARDAIERVRKRSGVKAQPLKRGWNYV